MRPRIEAYGIRTVVGHHLRGNSRDTQDKFFYHLETEHVAKFRNVLFHTHKDFSETDLFHIHSEIMENWDVYWSTSILVKKDTRPFAILDKNDPSLPTKYFGVRRQ